MCSPPTDKLSKSNDVVRQLAERIQALQAQVANGTFVPDREDNIQSRALGTKEHPGQARDVRLVPWQIAFENDQSAYISHGRNNARKIASVHEELSAMFEAKWKEKEAALTATYQAQIEAEQVSRGNFSSEQVHSSCRSTQLPQVDADSTFDVDHISEPTYFMLYMESQGCKALFRHKVAIDQVHPGNMINGRRCL